VVVVVVVAVGADGWSGGSKNILAWERQQLYVIDDSMESSRIIQ
jgi:hypothetical protein